MNFGYKHLTDRQIKRYTKQGILEQKLAEVEAINIFEKKVLDQMDNVSDELASKFLKRNRVNKRLLHTNKYFI